MTTTTRQQAAAAGAWAAPTNAMALYTAHGWAESVGPSCPTCKCCKRQATSYSPSGRTTIFDGINERTERKYIKTYRFQSSFPLQPLHTTNEPTKIIPTPEVCNGKNDTKSYELFSIVHNLQENRTEKRFNRSTNRPMLLRVINPFCHSTDSASMGTQRI